MTLYRKVGVGPTAYKIEQIRDDGIIRYVSDEHQGYQAWLKSGNMPEIIPYVSPAPIKDDDPALVATAKKQKISDVRQEFALNIEYNATEIALQNAKAIKAIAAGKVLPLSFLTMMTAIEVDATKLETKIAEIKTCTLLSQINKISS